MTKRMQAGKFKAECLKVLDKVNKTHETIIITKRNVPVAQLTPINPKELSIFGKLAGSVQIKGDLLSPIEEEWDAQT